VQAVERLATGRMVEESELESRWGQHFSLIHVVETGCGATQPPIQWVPNCHSSVTKRPGREADNSPPNTPAWHSTYLSVWTTLNLPRTNFLILYFTFQFRYTVKPVLNGPSIKRNFVLNGNIFRSRHCHSILSLNGNLTSEEKCSGPL
jgi:hypothetical protein